MFTLAVGKMPLVEWDGNPFRLTIMRDGEPILSVWPDSGPVLCCTRFGQMTPRWRHRSGEGRLPFGVGTPPEVVIDWVIENCGVPASEFGLSG